MPIYEFECDECKNRFEELLAGEEPVPPCPSCGSTGTRRRISMISPTSRQPRGAAVQSDLSMRREREAARGERLAETKRKRAAGEIPPPRKGGKAK